MWAAKTVETVKTCWICTGDPAAQYAKLCPKHEKQVLERAQRYNLPIHEAICQIRDSRAMQALIDQQ
jgi:hypothetical protein